MVNEDTMTARIGKIITFTICICTVLVVVKVLFVPNRLPYSGIDTMHVVQSENPGINDLNNGLMKKNQLGNMTRANSKREEERAILASMRGKNWTDLDHEQRNLLIKKWLCKKKKCDIN